MRLVKVELRRLASRRLFHILTALVIAGTGVAGTLTFIHSDDSPAAVAAARAERDSQVQRCIEEARVTPEGFGGDPADAGAFCRDEVGNPDPRFRYTEVRWVLMSMGIPMIMLGWLVGASFMGAEWNNRTLTSLLTWEPRRLRVLTAKAAALALVVFAWLVSLQALLAGSLYPAAHFEGDTAGVDGGLWIDLGEIAARVGALGAIAALMGFALATVGKNTAAALGVGFVQLAFVESTIRSLRPGWAGWLIGENLGLFLVGPRDFAHVGHSQMAAGSILLAYVLIALAAAALVFRDREMS